MQIRVARLPAIVRGREAVSFVITGPPTRVEKTGAPRWAKLATSGPADSAFGSFWLTDD